MTSIKIMDVISLTKELMAIPSVSGDELAVLAFLERVFPEYGFPSLRKIPLEDGTYCLAASKGKSDTWIVGHTDTVLGIVPIEEKDGNLYGRGSCDTKGNIAAALVASKHLSNINLLLTVGEESDFRGARRAAEDEDVMRGKRSSSLECRHYPWRYRQDYRRSRMLRRDSYSPSYMQRIQKCCVDYRGYSKNILECNPQNQSGS